jgi:cysteine synthase
MNRSLFFRMGIFLVCLCLLSVQTSAQTNLKSNADAIVAGVAGGGAAIGILVYFALSRPPSIKGCAVTGPNGLELKNEGDGQTFQLLGITSDVKPGDRVRVQGKKKAIGKSSSGNPTFLVEKLAKDYGACKTPSVKP